MSEYTKVTPEQEAVERLLNYEPSDLEAWHIGQRYMYYLTCARINGIERVGPNFGSREATEQYRRRLVAAEAAATRVLDQIHGTRSDNCVTVHYEITVFDEHTRRY